MEKLLHYCTFIQCNAYQKGLDCGSYIFVSNNSKVVSLFLYSLYSPISVYSLYMYLNTLLLSFLLWLSFSLFFLFYALFCTPPPGIIYSKTLSCHTITTGVINFQGSFIFKYCSLLKSNTTTPTYIKQLCMLMKLTTVINISCIIIVII